MQCVTLENWNYSYYKSENQRAMVSFGADEASLLTGKMLYFVTVIEDEQREVAQEEFADLALALWHLNTQFNHWEFVDPTNLKTDGCSTCVAH